ncbi:MAG: molecular chaperone GrpE [Parcubacteria group bacterium Gr01-1014_19]|nr:MAG: molecular chaperone GrpE [Parcubacteria group bacterium Gr01-1014_19]
MDDLKIPEKDGELEKLVKEKEEYLNGWKRAKADLINYQKDEAKRLDGFSKFAVASVAVDLIAVLDSFDLAKLSLTGDSPAAKGFSLIESQLMEVLKKYGVEKIKLELGAAFDPATQESVGEMESSHPPGSVAEVVNQGYVLNGKVVRPVKVKISK